MEHYLDPLRHRAESDLAWDIIRRGISNSVPRRFIEGIALSSNQPNSNGDSYDAHGGIAMELPLPLLWSHQWNRPLGMVTGLHVRGDSLHFTAEILNGGLTVADEVWHGLANRLGNGVSIGTWRRQSEIGRPGHYIKWVLRELSVCSLGADADARVTRCWEKAAVIYVNRPRETTLWSEA